MDKFPEYRYYRPITQGNALPFIDELEGQLPVSLLQEPQDPNPSGCPHGDDSVWDRLARVQEVA